VNQLLNGGHKPWMISPKQNRQLGRRVAPSCYSCRRGTTKEYVLDLFIFIRSNHLTAYRPSNPCQDTNSQKLELVERSKFPLVSQLFRRHERIPASLPEKESNDPPKFGSIVETQQRQYCPISLKTSPYPMRRQKHGMSWEHERKGIDVAPEELIYRILPLHIQRVAGIVLL
jgi:hypothetical protein